MKKLYISQPMRDKTDEQILAERARIMEVVKAKYPEEEIVVLDTFFQGAPHDAKPLWFLAKNLEFLSTADIAAFAPGWDKYRGCKVEHTCAEDYGIKIIMD